MSEIDTDDGGTVTYSGGRVVEQTTTGDTPDGDHGDELAAAKAAVKKAIEADAKADGATAAKEARAARGKDPLVPRDRDANAGDDPVEAEKEAAVRKLQEPDETASALKKALQERRETAKYKAEATAEVEKMRQETRQFYQQLQREKQEVAQERQRLALLRTDPVRAIKENGWDGEKFILDIAMDGTPEGARARQERELMARLERAEAWQKSQQDAETERKQEYEVNQRRQFRQNVEREFLKTTFDTKTDDGADKHPHLASFYKGHEVGLLAEADVVAEQYRNMTGKEATFAELAEYLEERAAMWYKSMSSKGQAPRLVTQGRPTQGSATGKKSLSPSGSSERRTLGSTYADLDGEDRLEAAKVAVRAAIHASGER